MSTIMGSSIEELNQRHCLSSKVEIRFTKSKGRYVVAKERLQAGEAFFVSQAYSNVILHEMIKFACANCRKIEYEPMESVQYDVSDKTKKNVDLASFVASRRTPELKLLPNPCDRCRLCYYCSDACKEEHYRVLHRYECEFFAKIRVLEENTPDVGLMDLDWDPPHERTLLKHLVRILCKRYEEQCRGSRAAASDFPQNDLSVAGLLKPTSNAVVTYQDDVLNLIFKSQMSEEHARVAAEAREILPLVYLPSNDAELAQVLSRVDCNKFGLFSKRGEVIGSALHPSASFVNHSCLPNSFSHIVGHTLTLYTLHPVEAGEELNISYIEPDLPVKDRRTALKKTYGFDCVCRRCTKEAHAHAAPKQMYEDFFNLHLNCPLCHAGLMMIAREDEIRSGKEEALLDSKLMAHIPEPIDGESTYRICNGCGKLQTRPIVPSIMEYRAQWVPPPTPADSKKPRKKESSS